MTYVVICAPWKSRLLPLATASLCGVALACESSGGSSPAGAASSAQAPLSPPAPKVEPPTPRAPVTFSSQDGATLAGDLHLAAVGAPAVVLVHRLHGDRSEFAPLAERLARAPKRYTVLNFDLRGHGDSKAPENDAERDAGRFTRDVSAAVAHLSSLSDAKISRFVLVGSSLGATLVSQVAGAEPRVVALGLVSPGGAIAGLDVYAPYAAVRGRPTFLAGADGDNVTRDAFAALSKMAKRGTPKKFDGAVHSAGHLAAAHPALWQDLEDWLVEVYDEPPEPAPAAIEAPGKVVEKR